MGRILIIFSLLALLAAVTVACGGNSSSAGPQEVSVSLTEFKVDSSVTSFTVGKEYRFVITDKGNVPHEWMIMPRGVADHMMALEEVEEDELPVGAKVTKFFTFTKAGDYEFACHLPGHYEAGMVQHITVQ